MSKPNLTQDLASFHTIDAVFTENVNKAEAAPIVGLYTPKLCQHLCVPRCNNDIS